jgi:hypothetical protein
MMILHENMNDRVKEMRKVQDQRFSTLEVKLNLLLGIKDEMSSSTNELKKEYDQEPTARPFFVEEGKATAGHLILFDKDAESRTSKNRKQMGKSIVNVRPLSNDDYSDYSGED